MTIGSFNAETKRPFAEQTDEINRLSRVEGPGPDAAADLAEILAEHERECEAVLRTRSVERGGSATRR